MEKKRAREIYEQQVAKGNDTAIAEKNDFKTFDVSIGRIRAGQDTRVRLVYYQPLDVDLNIGRYLYPLAEGNTDDDRIPFWSVDDKVTGAFHFELLLKSAFPIREVRVPGLESTAQIERVGGTGQGESSMSEVYRVVVDCQGGASLARDVVVYYRLADDIPARVELIPYRESESEPGTFLMVMTPAADLKRITEGTDWIFVLDVSGSMGGGKIASLADGVSRVLGKMSPNDRFHIITFNDSARDLTGATLPATPENVNAWIERIKNLQAEGGTALFDGLEKGYRALEEDRTTSIILVTDGVCNVGPTQHDAFLKLCRNHDVRLFTFVIGNSANQPLMERLALETDGFAMNLSDSDDIGGRILQAKAKVLNECLHGVQVRFAGEKVRDVTPARAGSLYMGQQLVMFGHYDGDGPVDIELSARVSGEDRTWHTTATLPAVDRDHPELERLWALSRVDEIMQDIREHGETDGLREKVADLGTEYSLVTDYTSMLVVRDDEAEELGIQHSNLKRVTREREAQQRRESAPVVSYRVDQSSGSNGGGMFGNKSSPGVGTGPVGVIFVAAAGWLWRRNKTK